MDFHALTPDGGVTHVCATHRLPNDDGPLQMISAAQLAHYRAIEAAHLALLQSLAALISAPQA